MLEQLIAEEVASATATQFWTGIGLLIVLAIDVLVIVISRDDDVYVPACLFSLIAILFLLVGFFVATDAKHAPLTAIMDRSISVRDAARIDYQRLLEDVSEK